MRAFLNGPATSGEPLRLLMRAEGVHGVVGDASVTIRPGEKAAGVPYAALLALLQDQGWVDLPGATEGRLHIAAAAYLCRFPGAALPCPACINPDHIAQVMFEAIEAGEPVPEDFDWWRDVPPDAVA